MVFARRRRSIRATLATMGQKGRELVRDDFAWPNIAGQFITTYEIAARVRRNDHFRLSSGERRLNHMQRRALFGVGGMALAGAGFLSPIGGPSPTGAGRIQDGQRQGSAVRRRGDSHRRYRSNSGSRRLLLRLARLPMARRK